MAGEICDVPVFRDSDNKSRLKQPKLSGRGDFLGRHGMRLFTGQMNNSQRLDTSEVW